MRKWRSAMTDRSRSDSNEIIPLFHFLCQQQRRLCSVVHISLFRALSVFILLMYCCWCWCEVMVMLMRLLSIVIYLAMMFTGVRRANIICMYIFRDKILNASIDTQTYCGMQQKQMKNCVRFAVRCAEECEVASFVMSPYCNWIILGCSSIPFVHATVDSTLSFIRLVDTGFVRCCCLYSVRWKKLSSATATATFNNHNVIQ